MDADDDDDNIPSNGGDDSSDPPSDYDPDADPLVAPLLLAAAASASAGVDLNQSPLHAVRWRRVVLDEAHNIKDKTTNTARSCFLLRSKYRWALSGTPLQNRVAELYSQIRFLRPNPFAYFYCTKCPCRSLDHPFARDWAKAIM
jgi:SNF2 family DNA or RNA helicase